MKTGSSAHPSFGWRCRSGLAEPLGIFLGLRVSPQENAARFSKLVASGREAEVLKVLQLLDPRRRRLLILVSGGVPMVHGDVGVGPPIPLPLMGEGVARSAALPLAIAAAPRGSVLVDDIEYGFHYSVLPGIWKAIAAAAREYDT